MQSERYDSSPSSPDPLNDSLVFRAPPSTKRRKTPHSRLSLPTPGSSPRKQIFELDVGDAISPQKIRVTVQAGDSDEEDDHANLRPHNFSSPTPAPIPRRIERTTTTTVPLRGLSDTEDNVQYGATPKRGRGRPRKSNTPVKRLATPVRGRKRGRKSAGEQVDDQDTNDYFIGDTEGETSHKKQRSRSVKGATPKKPTSSKKKTPLETAASSVASKRGRRRPRSKLREEIRFSDDDRNGSVEEPKVTNDEGLLVSPKFQGNTPQEDFQLPDSGSRNGVQDIHEDLLPEEIDLLETIDANPSNPRSTYLTDESTSPIPSIEGDIVIARFHPGEETPPTTGWSSSRFMDEHETASSPSKPGGETSPYEENARSAEPLPQSNTLSDQDHENYDHMKGSDEIDQVMEESHDEAFSDDELDDASEAPPRDDLSEDEMDDDDDDDHRPEFDTIMESEGFSLISLDSVPSLRKPLSGPIQEQEQTPALPLQHKGLLSVQDAHNAGENNSFSSIASDVLQAATPGMKAHNPQLLRVQNSRINDSFSSIPPEILEAATPARNLSNKQPLLPDDSSGIEDDKTDEASKKSPSKSLVTARKSNSVYNDDSFSTIPPSILEAATPRPLRKAPLRPSSLAKSKLASSDAPSSSQKQPSSTRSTESAKKMESLSPPADEAQTDPPDPARNSVTESPASRAASQLVEDSVVNSQMQSSPPTMAPRGNTHTARLHQQRQANPEMTQTPPVLFSSPSLPPPIQPSRQPSRQPSEKPDSATTNTTNTTNAPSPAEKAGRVLQDIIIPSSLPRKTNIIRSNPIEHAKQSLPRLDHNEELMPQRSHRRNWSRTIHNDTFNNSGASQRRFSTDRNQSFNLTLPSSRHLSNSINATISPHAVPVRQEDAVDQNSPMRRVDKAPDELAAVQSPVKSRARAGKGKTVSWEEKWASERAAVSKQISAADDNKVIVVESEDDNQNPNDNNDAEVGDDDEEEEQEEEIKQIDDKAITRSSEHAVIEDDVDDEDFGLLLETLNSSQQEAQLKSDLSDAPRRTPESPLGSAPRALPEDNPSPRTVPRQADGRQQPQSKPPIDGDETLDLSGWHIPQKSNFEPRPRSTSRRNSDISALLGSPPMQGLTDLTNGRERTSSAESASVEPEAAHKLNTKPSSTELKNTVREQVEPYIPIPQKVGFQPRPRKAAEQIPPSPTPQPTKTSKGIFGLLGARTKTKTDLPTPDSSSSMNQSSQSNKAFAPAPSAPSAPQNHKENHHPSSNTKDNNSNNNPPPKWTQPTPPLQAPLSVPPSPTKSILRSPQRPSFHSQPIQLSPSKNVVFASSSPQSSEGSPYLSPTIWTRDHWLLLDAIVKSWRPENQDEDGEGGKYGRRNSTRVISRLLGKWVSLRNANGNGKVKTEDGVVGRERMRLEQWHLEAVDEFRGEVPGWDENVVAKRVFALIVGEERRRKGLVR
ncbi:hypothetical protein ACMFMG_009891 [Clarireedia jacksonii]